MALGLRSAWLAFGLIAATAPASAADRHQVVAGWTLEDVGSKPGDDSDREVAMRKSSPDVTLSYRPGETGAGGSIQIQFNRCQGLNYGSGFTFDDPPADRAAQVRKEIADAFAEFARNCRGGGDGQAALMQGFDEAFRTIDAWMKATPFVYAPDAPDKPDAPAQPDQPDAAATPTI